MQAQVIIPDLPLDGLNIAGLVHLLEFIEPVGAQFDSASRDKSYPFVIPSTEYPGTVEDTPIGEVISAISLWGDRQKERIVAALKNAPREGEIEALWRDLALLRDHIENHEWASAQLILANRIVGEESRVRKAGVR